MLAALISFGCSQPNSPTTYDIKVQDENGDWVDSGYDIHVNPGSGAKTWELRGSNGGVLANGTYGGNGSTAQPYTSTDGTGQNGQPAEGTATTDPNDNTVADYDGTGAGWPAGLPRSGKIKLCAQTPPAPPN